MQYLIALLFTAAPVSGQLLSAEAGMMPEVVITAPCDTVDEYKTNKIQSLFAHFAFAQSIPVPKNLPVASKFAGNLHVPAGDTIDEDVTVSGGNATIDGVIDGDLAVMGGIVEINGLIDGDVAVMGGNLRIIGEVNGDAAVFGGNVSNQGIIRGDILVIGGTILLDSNSVVEGDVNMIGGTVDRDENAIIHGEIQSVESEALKRFLPNVGKAFKIPDVLPGHRFFARIFMFALFFVIYLINLILFLIFPDAHKRIINMLTQNVWASVGMGLGLEILYIPIILLFTISIIGIPLIPLFMLGVLLCAIFGFSSLSFILGERVIKGMNWKIENNAGIFSLGWVSLMIIPFILVLIGPPAAGLGIIIIYVAATIGLGAVLLTLIKKKSTVRGHK